ncbi:aldo/keto reductase [Lentzea sp. NPDC059081]|uniref:aldo/keto reductase n=1 Tax=Lentzea sp. NPDC059081 TaxID=3346719 RepID=UPI0036881583
MQHLVLGDIPVHRLGFGAMRMPADDPAAAHALARRAVELGVTFLDTADSYDLGRNEELLAEALHPYPGDVVVATKAGQCHPGDDWIPLGRPEYLRQQAELSLRRLRVERIDLFQLHRVDPAVPLADQIGAVRRLQDEGKVRHVGLSEVSVEQIVEAGRITPIVSVQNRYNLADRRSEDVLAHCERHGIAFLPWLPIAPSVRTDSPVTDVARRLGVSPAQVALAWLLRRSEVMLPIPGTSSLQHLEENTGAVDIVLSDEDFEALSCGKRDFVPSQTGR